MWNDIERLHHYHRDVPAEFRVLKIAEEVGEAAEALIGLRGLNKRKGTCRTRDDLLDELADVIITAAVAMASVTDGDTGEARSHFGRRLQTITARTGTASPAAPPSAGGHEPIAHRPALFPVSVKAVVVRDGKVLLLRNERDEWELPGGKLELGEDPPERLRQEIAEECGWDATIGPILDAWQYRIRDGVDVLVVTYGAVATTNDPPVLSHEHTQAGLFAEHEVVGLAIPEGYKRSIAAWYARLRQPAQQSPG